MKLVKRILLILSAISFLVMNFTFSVKNIAVSVTVLAVSLLIYTVLNLDLFSIYRTKNYGLLAVCAFFNFILIKRFYEYFITSSKLQFISEAVNINKQVILIFAAAVIYVLSYNVIYILGYVVTDLIRNSNNYRYNAIEQKKSLKIFNRCLTTLVLILGGFILSALSNAFIFSNNLLNTDGSVFNYVAFAIKNGQIPYKDTFDHKGPLQYLINYIGYLIDPRKGIWYLEFIAILLTVFFVFKIANKFSNVFSSIVATILVMAPLSSTFEGGNLVEEFAMPFITASIYIFIIYFFSGNIKTYQLVLCGFCGGCVLMLRPNMAVVWLVMPIAVVINETVFKKSKDVYRYFGYFVLGVAVAIVPFILYFAVNNALFDFFNCYIKFNLMYSGEKYVSTVEAIKKFSGSVIFRASLTVVLFHIIAKKNVLFNITYLIFLIANLLAVSMSGRLYAHYAMLLIPAAAYPMGLLTSYLFLFRLKKNYVACIPIIIATVLLLLATFNIGWIIPYNKTIDGITGKSTVSHLRPVEEAANYIMEKTEEDDRILVVGNENQIYTLSGRLSATKYSYQIPIINVGEDIKKEFFAEITQSPPKLIVVIDHIPEIKEFIETNNYNEVKRLGGYIFYGNE